MKDQLQGMSEDNIRALAAKQLREQEKRRNYQNDWRHRNKKRVAKYNQDYRDKMKLKAGVAVVRV